MAAAERISRTTARLRSSHNHFFSPSLPQTGMALLFVLGCVFFPVFFAVLRWGLQNYTKLQMEAREAVLVASKLVSSVQAIMASTAGYIVSTSCKHIIDDQHWLSSAYTQFAVPYFIYDIYAMFLCHWHKHQVKGHGGDDDGRRGARGSTWAVVRGYLHKEFLMVLHHAVMVLVCFPVSVVWRQGKGDFFLGCMLMAEVSTPFVCLGKILIQYKQQHTLLHKVNGALMLLSFLCCRVLLFPYLYWAYGRHAGLPLLAVPLAIPAHVNLGAALLLAPQLYWFFLICRGACRLFRPRGSPPPSPCQTQD
ncbi:family with sequence similarity 57 member B, transcript variant X1 [Ictidomys tridecemlineatus]|nr:family with sequence similarity 57 member B, transcript variant X1 [Ictidomys tridecemlineatus]